MSAQPRTTALWLDLKPSHASLLKQFASHPRFVLIGAALLSLLAVAVASTLTTNLLPAFDEGRMIVAIDAPSSTTLEAMRRYGITIAQDLRSIPGVTSVAQEIGRDPTGVESFGLGHSVFDIGLNPDLSAHGEDRLKAQIRQRLSLYPGLNPVTQSGHRS